MHTNTFTHIMVHQTWRLRWTITSAPFQLLLLLLYRIYPNCGLCSSCHLLLTSHYLGTYVTYTVIIIIIMIWSILEGIWQQNITRRTCDREESLTGTYTRAKALKKNKSYWHNAVLIIIIILRVTLVKWWCFYFILQLIRVKSQSFNGSFLSANRKENKILYTHKHNILVYNIVLYI